MFQRNGLAASFAAVGVALCVFLFALAADDGTLRYRDFPKPPRPAVVDRAVGGIPMTLQRLAGLPFAAGQRRLAAVPRGAARLVPVARVGRDAAPPDAVGTPRRELASAPTAPSPRRGRPGRGQPEARSGPLPRDPLPLGGPPSPVSGGPGPQTPAPPAPQGPAPPVSPPPPEPPPGPRDIDTGGPALPAGPAPAGEPLPPPEEEEEMPPRQEPTGPTPDGEAPHEYPPAEVLDSGPEARYGAEDTPGVPG